MGETPSLVKPTKPTDAIVRMVFKTTVVQIEIKKPTGKWDKVAGESYAKVEFDDYAEQPTNLGLSTITGLTRLMQDNKDTDQAGRLRADLTEPRDPNGAPDEAITNLPQPDETILANAATTPEDLAVLAPIIPAATAEAIGQSDPDLDADVTDWFADTTDRPRLSVLGPVKVRLGRGGKPAEAAKRKPYYTELFAYLATRPTGATTQQLCRAFAVTPAPLSVVVNRASKL